MKNLLFITATVLFTSYVSAEVDLSKFTKLNRSTSTEAQYRTVYEAMLSATNSQEAMNLLWHTSWHNIMKNPNAKHLIEEFDEELAKKFPDGSFGSPFWGKFIKTSKLRRKKLRIDTCMPKTTAIIEKYQPYYGNVVGSLSHAGATIEDLITVMGESVSASTVSDISYLLISDGGLQKFKGAIQKMASKGIKRKLREQGKTFVTKDGVNPCEEYLTRLNAALDAPNFAGLNEWLSDLGYNVQIDPSKFLTAEQIAKLKEAVYYGEVDMTEKTKLALIVGLGIDEYNKFVTEYNSGK
jgi:hypothetical protein